jgi:hypothetical protein
MSRERRTAVAQQVGAARVQGLCGECQCRRSGRRADRGPAKDHPIAEAILV